MVKACFLSFSQWLQDWSGQNVSDIASELCGFITVLSGTVLLHAAREQEMAPAAGMDRMSIAALICGTDFVEPVLNGASKIFRTRIRVSLCHLSCPTLFFFPL